MRLCVLDGYTLNPGDNPWTALAELGSLTVHDRTPAEQIVERATGAEVVLTNKTPLDAATLARLPELRFISVLATGVNVVDLEAARGRNIAVSNVPVYGTDSVAQHVLALLLELASGVGVRERSVRDGQWIGSPDFSFWERAPLELAGLTFGVVGYGRIGRRVGELMEALGMHVIAAAGRDGETSDIRRVSLDKLFAISDVVSLHCPLTRENERFVDASRLTRMKPTALFLNTARGGLVDESALAAALRENRIAGAGLDVLAVEPMHPDCPLRDVPNCVITPHVAWASLAARRRLMTQTVENVRAYRDGNPINRVV